MKETNSKKRKFCDKKKKTKNSNSNSNSADFSQIYKK